ncbi:9141_t:CDS:2 [Cetraspora pellucida]|uniref:9141_t:CDS:1 n=1 Tax=Cetraspora pellucida TaxID=1433469 RepID=A0ACA9P767_9GLOM|nr:9141_t:CDS:2 [Cetraspora pellucida]
MSCYADTIIKVNQVRQTCNEDSKLFAVQAVGVYPIESEDCELDMTLFILMNDEERDPNSQSIFETNEYYCVGRKIMLGSYNRNLRLKMTVASSTHLSIKKDFSSNRWSLKVLLVSVAKDAPKEINYKNAILNSVQTRVILVIFYCLNNEKSLKSHESGTLVDTGSATKKKVNISENTPALYRSICSILVNVYQSVNKDSSKAARLKNSDLDNKKSKLVTDLTTEDFYINKRTRVEDEKDDFTEYVDKHTNDRDKESMNRSNKYKSGIVQDNKSSECNYENLNKDKEKIIQPVVHNTRQWSELFKIINSSERV